MKKPILLLFAAVAVASASDLSAGQGYTFFSPVVNTGNSNILHVGAGGEGFIWKDLGAGGELGYAFPARSFRSGVGLASVNASYHLNRGGPWMISPFATGGYTLGFRSGVGHFVNFGGGINYWLSSRMGLRLEVRDYVYTQCGCDHTVEFRIGFAFR